MNTNSTFSIGKDHIVCEDYALSSQFGGLAYAIVCDGCSASPDVDFGARVMAMSAKRNFRLNEDRLNQREFGEMAIRNAQKVFDVFPYLSPQALDSTLLAACVKDRKLTAYMYGDGVLIHRSSWGRLFTVHINLSSGAPDYLSYDMDPMRRQSYEKLEDNQKIVEVTIDRKLVPLTDNEKPKTFKPLEPYWITNVAVSEGDIIAVISDGINSFRKADNTPIPWTDLIEEFTDYKSTQGEFVLRRISAFKRKCLKEGITHSDDISIAAISV